MRLSEMDFGRVGPGGGLRDTATAEALFSRVREGGKSQKALRREALSVRLHEDVLDKLRWMVGDYIRVKPMDDDGTQWKIYRVSGPTEGGIRLTRSGDKESRSRSGTSRFTMPTPVLDAIFKNGSKHFTASMVDSNRTEAIFLAD
jgi:hypothetical protein